MLSFPTGNEIVIDHTSLKIDIFILTDSELNESQQKVSTRIISYSFSKVQRSPTVSYDLSIAVDCKTVESSNKDYKL